MFLAISPAVWHFGYLAVTTVALATTVLLYQHPIRTPFVWLPLTIAGAIAILALLVAGLR